MGRSLSSNLMYGYDLGGREGEWTCIPYNREEYTYTWPAWVKLDADGYPDEEEDEGFAQQMSKRLEDVLLKEAGFTEPEPDWIEEREEWYAYLNRRREAQERLRLGGGPEELDLEFYGVSDYAGWVLGISIASGHSLQPFEFGALAPPYTEQRADWDRRLKRAIEILEVRPEADRPGFFLVTHLS